MRAFTFLSLLASLGLTAYSAFLFFTVGSGSIAICCIALIALSGGLAPWLFWITHREFFIFYTFFLSVFLAIVLLPGTLFGISVCIERSLGVPLLEILALFFICLVVILPVPFAFVIRREVLRLEDERLTGRCSEPEEKSKGESRK
jgi:hypothetical protein